jgi:hypothetical protein
MTSGKLVEELERMSQIADRIGPNSVILATSPSPPPMSGRAPRSPDRLCWP